MLLMVVFVLLFPQTMTDDINNQVTLHIEESCWFYLDQDPILVCTVTSPTPDVIWKKDTTIVAIDGSPVGDDRHLYTVSSYKKQNDTVRVEMLEVSENISSLAVEGESEFWCESQGIASEHKPLIVPECEECNSCPTTTRLGPVVKSIPAVVPGDSSKATMILFGTFGVAAILILVVVAPFLVSRHRNQRRLRTADPHNHDDAHDDAASCMDGISELDGLGPLFENHAPMQSRGAACNSMPVLTSSSLRGTPPGSVHSLSKVEYLNPNEYKLKKMPSYQRMRTSLLHGLFTGSNAPIVIPEEDVL